MGQNHILVGLGDIRLEHVGIGLEQIGLAAQQDIAARVLHLCLDAGHQLTRAGFDDLYVDVRIRLLEQLQDGICDLRAAAGVDH